MNRLARCVCLAAATIALATSAHAENLAGSYRVEGKNFDGSGYTGTAVISITSRSECRITWTTPGSNSSGMCMRQGRAFSASYKSGGERGLATYELQADGRLYGTWTLSDTHGVGSEVLTPLR